MSLIILGMIFVGMTCVKYFNQEMDLNGVLSFLNGFSLMIFGLILWAKDKIIKEIRDFENGK